MSSGADIKQWVKTLPPSVIAFPRSALGRLQRTFWRFYTPRHASIRDKLLSLGIIKKPPGRHTYLIGTIASHSNPREVIARLVEHGYGNCFVSWKDGGELANLRAVPSFTHQYHVLVYEDGEVRGHYEYTPEYAPISHMRKIGEEDRREEFISLLEKHIVPCELSA